MSRRRFRYSNWRGGQESAPQRWLRTTELGSVVQAVGRRGDATCVADPGARHGDPCAAMPAAIMVAPRAPSFWTADRDGDAAQFRLLHARRRAAAHVWRGCSAV
jgi:hypothetical protein